MEAAASCGGPAGGQERPRRRRHRSLLTQPTPSTFFERSDRGRSKANPKKFLFENTKTCSRTVQRRKMVTVKYTLVAQQSPAERAIDVSNSRDTNTT
mmetsp:Transcript_17744/g.40964  ORF Transcript_17744/g.40964 Transcript_17744/m.40964 type:complete len:97 (+) Transcript_17744:540-830(+)